AAVDRVLASGWFILGPEVEAFEAEFAAASGASHAIGVGNGTDAIAVILRGLGIGPGDEVITTPLSAAYSALAIMMAGARPVFADVDPPRLTIDPAGIAAGGGPRARAGGGGGRARDGRDSPGASLRAARRHGGDCGRRGPPPPGDRRRLLSGAS